VPAGIQAIPGFGTPGSFELGGAGHDEIAADPALDEASVRASPSRRHDEHDAVSIEIATATTNVPRRLDPPFGAFVARQVAAPLERR